MEKVPNVAALKTLVSILETSDPDKYNQDNGHDCAEGIAKRHPVFAAQLSGIRAKLEASPDILCTCTDCCSRELFGLPADKRSLLFGANRMGEQRTLEEEINLINDTIKTLEEVS